jgi:hypothetical protein
MSYAPEFYIARLKGAIVDDNIITFIFFYQFPITSIHAPMEKTAAQEQ